ncbi:MAG: hypothetical protein ABSC34_00060 [Acidimicrobiales bacterium]
MIDPRFIYLAIFLALAGMTVYVRDTLRGDTTPNRVTWSLWGVEGVLIFFVEVQQHVGPASLMTLTLGLVPLVVVAASFRSPHHAWRVGTFDVFCGVLSVVGLIFWCFVNEPTVALVSFMAADQAAALPTLRKSWIAPSTESAGAFFLGFANCAITLLTLKRLTTAGVLFPGCILITDLIIGVLVITDLGPRLRGYPRPAPSPRVP